MNKVTWQAISIVLFFLIVGFLAGAMPLPTAAVIVLFTGVLITFKWIEITKPQRLIKKLNIRCFTAKKL